MPNRDKTGRLGRGKECDETAKADRIGKRPMRGKRRKANIGRGRSE